MYPHIPLSRRDFGVLSALWPHHFEGQILSEYDPRLQVCVWARGVRIACIEGSSCRCSRSHSTPLIH